VSVKIYNMLGQEVRTLVREPMIAGYHETVWDGTNSSGRVAGSGIYFYRFEASPINGEAKFLQIRKMILLK
jgi:flagellar hook assembly protein FlgD